jgi:DNA recombination protein RmuC
MDEMMFVGAIGLAGILIGAIIGYVIASTKTKDALETYTLQSYGNTRILESTAVELRNKVAEMRNAADARSKENARLQEQLRAEAELKAAAQAELKDARSALDAFSGDRDKLLAESQRRAVAENKLAQSQISFDVLRKTIEDAEVRMVDAFNALSSSALRSNNETFMTYARSAFESIQARAEGNLDTRQHALEGLVNPLKDALGRYERQIVELERTRQSAFGSLEDQLKSLATSNLKLQSETGGLANALRTPQVRGRWGEMTLRRAAELAGMSAQCDFTERASLEEGGRHPHGSRGSPNCRGCKSSAPGLSRCRGRAGRGAAQHRIFQTCATGANSHEPTRFARILGATRTRARVRGSFPAGRIFLCRRGRARSDAH